MFNLRRKKFLALFLAVLTVLSSLSVANASQYKQKINAEEPSIPEVVSLYIENKDITIEHQGIFSNCIPSR